MINKIRRRGVVFCGERAILRSGCLNLIKYAPFPPPPSRARFAGQVSMVDNRPTGGRRRRRGPASRRALAHAAAAVAAGAAFALLPWQAQAQLDFVPRNFTGEGNNLEFPAWGAAGTTQVCGCARRTVRY